ncbi:hypothetical protein CVT25_002978 [Psilocybe cyanescens]|uniref:Laccase n=1 Tax=Psilocybe cyanescens TaxID=93625 RepID=A0A409WMT4_PSICY|nr:hypothetical protein CVT25_002978 [Psilocybe cyanescens]
MLTSTSVHWHGFSQAGTQWADGTAEVTQCPIVPGNSFLYQFSTQNQAGTYWYHSHYSTQYCDGLKGPLVVYDPADPHRSKYDIDDESTIITLSDWYHTPAPTIEFPPVSSATLINGKGRYAGGPNTPLSVITVLPYLRYRFRLVSLSCDPDFTVSIDGHTMTIIEVDSVNVTPLVVDEINILAGQRYSFVLNANKPIGNYWIRVNPNSGKQGFDNGINSAILRYAGAPKVDPKTKTSVTNPLLETNLHPLVNPAAPGLPFPGGADVKIHLDIQFDFSVQRFTVNGASYTPPSIPVLLQILSGKSQAQDLLNPGSMYALPPNKVIEISMNSGSLASPHPMHLHGHKFSVIQSAGSSGYNFVNPVRRDVVSIGSDPTQNVTIRFKTDNPGPWIFHCHVDWHLDAGLSVVFAEDMPSIAKSKHPVAWDKLCPSYNALPPQTFP